MIRLQKSFLEAVQKFQEEALNPLKNDGLRWLLRIGTFDALVYELIVDISATFPLVVYQAQQDNLPGSLLTNRPRKKVLEKRYVSKSALILVNGRFR